MEKSSDDKTQLIKSNTTNWRQNFNRINNCEHSKDGRTTGTTGDIQSDGKVL